MSTHLTFLLCILSILFQPSQSSSSPDEFYFTRFTSQPNSNLTLSGIAEIQSNGIIKLTNDTSRLLGHTFYTKPIRFKGSSSGKAFSFSTNFVFAIVPEYPKLGGHGMAFAIASSKTLPNALPSQYLGLLNSTDNGNISNHIFAIEFDTVQDFEFRDINDNHVGLDINSMVSNASVAAGFYEGDGVAVKRDLNLKSGKMIQCWIDYDSAKNELNVTLSENSIKPRIPILQFNVDLSDVVEEFMYAGFSASTGLLASSHYVFGWSFKVNGVAKSLSLNELPKLPKIKHPITPLITGLSVSAALVGAAVVVGLGFYIVRRVKNADRTEDWELEVGPHRYSYKELKAATKGFSEKELIGFGGFGKVYRGVLVSGKTEMVVAVKRIAHESRQGLQEFASEITSMGRLRHRNLVQLLGWCRRREDLLLVYDYMENGSLDKYIYDQPRSILAWQQRFKIIKDVARGLLYLHEEYEQTVIHRDIKAANVLLDSAFNGRLSDFGLAKLFEHGSDPGTTRVVGTLGYLAPELSRTGRPTTSSDVFAFGALLLEMVCGRRPIAPKTAPEEMVLVEWVWEQWKVGMLAKVVDVRMGAEFDVHEVEMVLKLGLMCSSNSVSRRPGMRMVVRYLNGEVDLPEMLDTPDSFGSVREVDGFEDYVHSYQTSSFFGNAASVSDTAGSGQVLVSGGP